MLPRLTEAPISQMLLHLTETFEETLRDRTIFQLPADIADRLLPLLSSHWGQLLNDVFPSILHTDEQRDVLSVLFDLSKFFVVLAGKDVADSRVRRFDALHDSPAVREKLV